MKNSVTLTVSAEQKPNKARNMLLRMNPSMWIGVIIIAVLLVAAVLAPQLSFYPPAKQNLFDQLSPPSADYLLGADQYGRDILTRLLYGARYSLLIGSLAVVIAMVIGTLIGMMAGFRGGKIDIVLMQIMDVILAFPSLILGIALVALMGATMTNIIAAIAFTSVPAFARVARAAVLTQRDREYVQACSAMGFSGSRTLFRHILPAILPEVMVLASLWMANAVRTEASLAFVGLGIAPPAPTWGGMVRDGFTVILSSPYLAIFPSLAILLLVLAFNLIGDGLRDLIDPRMKDLN
ncbi:peptide/nickel transport system permease protein (plasmid) [Agrobacterium tumefaciens]|uniref:ABC transporter permease n=3 Tax=Rhizobiaceae TaxID=82115 RepID=O50269_AGRTU|nr:MULTISPECIES: ABC transporter permease [Rhizobium/Agrobacterium group]AHK05231.1 mannopinic acid permease [Agrobacterium tumefaciens LBA4213 (Ach5)]AKC10960.1 ABC transporter permease [Agrobacterium tumefaciens]AAB88474.1 moaC [Agrobacterium tumefaciens]ASK41581.1 ABC transporter permease [Agrobacterium tumefaciens]ASK47124.1 ABC transporter permease [Agrobacterium radiobacter]